MTQLVYQGFTSPADWWSFTGDAVAVDQQFQQWIQKININPSQVNRNVTYYYGPGNAFSSSSSAEKGSLASFPQSTTSDDLIWFGFWAKQSTMRVQMHTDWEFGPYQNGYGQASADSVGTEITLPFQGTTAQALRGYLIATSVIDNQEFFCLAYDTGSASQFHNAFIVFKGTNGAWIAATYGPVSNTALCYSTTNNSWNLNSNSKLDSPTVLLPLVHNFTTSEQQPYLIGQFSGQAASPDLYVLNQTSEFGMYQAMEDGTYIASMGYNAIWVRYGYDAVPTPPPVQTFVITVDFDISSTRRYFVDGVQTPTLVLTRGLTYEFNQEDSSNRGHPIAFYEEENKVNQWLNGIINEGDTGYTGAKTTFVVPEDAPNQLYYECQAHSEMGGLIEVTG